MRFILIKKRREQFALFFFVCPALGEGRFARLPLRERPLCPPFLPGLSLCLLLRACLAQYAVIGRLSRGGGGDLLQGAVPNKLL